MENVKFSIVTDRVVLKICFYALFSIHANSHLKALSAKENYSTDHYENLFWVMSNLNYMSFGLIFCLIITQIESYLMHFGEN